MFNAGGRAKGFQRTLAGAKKTSVAHDAADPFGCSDNLRIASGGLQDAENPGVKYGDDLRQPCSHRDFANA